MDYGWDTSEEEGGMEIDLNAQQEEQRELHLARSGADRTGMTEKGKQRASLTEDYDPSEPTDDYDPSEPTKDSDTDTYNKDVLVDRNDKSGLSPISPDQNYDPAEPTLSDEDHDSNSSFKEEECQLSADPKQKENTDDENDGRWDSQMPLSQDAYVSSPCEDKVCDNRSQPSDQLQFQQEAEKNGNNCSELSGSSSQKDSQPAELDKSKSTSPLFEPIDTDDNTQNSILDDIEVPDVTFDESDFVLEKEPIEKGRSEQRELTSSPWSDSGDCERKGEYLRQGEDNTAKDPEESESPSSDQKHSFSQEEGRERFRRQEEVDTRNEEALVDLFREESDADRIEADIAQPVKKTKKKLVPKKVKKKGKKLKKDQGKKGHGKQQNETGVEDQRFVEIRRDRLSTDVREEGELEGDLNNASHRKSYEERVSLDAYEQTFDIGTGHQLEDEQREPGEIVDEGKKRWKKRDKKERKKKKSRREVATIEEGNQGDDDSQKFPSFLAGFFVQDEAGEEELEEHLESASRSFENEEERTFQKGGKIYRKRHTSEAEDSVKSFDKNVTESQEGHTQESEHRKNRKHDERGHESRDRRQPEVRDVREVRREKDHRHGTPRDRERERDRDRDRERERSRGERVRERLRVRERERERERDRDREREVVWGARDRSRRVEIEERRGHRVRSGSREHRLRSGTAERARRSRSRDRSARHRRNRSKSRERSPERERERERSKRRHREKSHEREPERRVRRPSHSRSRSPRHRSERAGSNKENREENRRRRRHVRPQEDSESEDRVSGHRRHRRERREPERSSSTSSSSVSSDSGTKQRRSRHHHNFRGHHSSDEGASSDVILVEPERIVINLDEEEDPPSRVDITHANAEDDSTKLVDGESIPPPPELSRNSRSSALIQINPAEPDVEDNDQSEEPEGDATPTRDELSDDAQQRWNDKRVQESDYDPAHPTEEGEEHDSRPSTSNTSKSPALPLAELGPVPPDHPPPEEVRPAPPPVPSVIETNTTILNSQQSPMPGGPRPQLLMSPFQAQPLRQLHTLQQQSSLMPFPGGAISGPGQPQRFPPWPLANGPNSNMLPQNTGTTATFPPSQRGLLPTPDTRPMFSVENSRLTLQFGASLPHLSHPPPPRDSLSQQMNNVRPPMPLSAMAPLAQLTSLLPGLDRSKMASHRDEHGMPLPSQIFKHSLPAVSAQSSTVGKGPLVSSSAANMSSGVVRSSRGQGDQSESTEVVDMDMSPGEDDCELELPSPNSSDSDRDNKRRRSRKSDSRMARVTIDNCKPGSGADKGLIQPAMYLKALSKAIEKLTPKPQPSTAGPAAASQDKSKPQAGKKKKNTEANEEDVPASAVDLTNKEKFLKKLHLQERVIDEVKLAIKPFYSSKKITKEQYKLILRKAVPKVCHSKSGNINPQKIQQLVEAYVGKLKKGKEPGSGKKKKHHAAKESQAPKEAGSTAVNQNGDWSKKPTR